MKTIIIILLYFFAGAIMFGTMFLLFDEAQKLPGEKHPCIYEIYSYKNTEKPKGVASYYGSGQRITAWHVIKDIDEDMLFVQNYSDNPYLQNKPKERIGGKVFKPQNLGNDVGLFYISIPQPLYGGKTSTRKIGLSLDMGLNCDPHYESGLYTYISGDLQKIPVVLSGTFIDYNPDYGQSGSPIFSGGKIIGIISRKYDSGAIISLVP